MTPDSARAIELFTEAIQLPVEERAAFLDRACGQDEGLRRKIEALLKSNERVGTFLEEPPTKAIGDSRVKTGAGEKPGDRIGHFKLLQQIGEGGCGIVFMAEQEEPVRRRVALKVIKPGMDTKSVIARFEAERQALAMMDHPDIAHVFDAGATESGRPYFVMELVEGVKITDYCDQHSLPIGARLELFVQVCDAIQHAHQKGIIHRDIKPSNILVTTGPDGKPAPKIIDFGIAKATTGQQLTDKTIFTAFEMLIGTPAYMSPEQAALTNADVDTRSDIYSLGVLLYELLTGTTPFDTRELLKAGFDEVRRVIRDEEPVRPSTRVSTMPGAELVNVSKHHGAEAPKLIREMRGDLDWIVMKTLEKDRARRYATANSLAEDIHHYLENETVTARPPSRLYQFQKLVSRHKLGFTAFGIVMVTLVAGLSVTTWSLAQERKAYREADAARGDANDQRKKAQLGEQNALTEAARSQQVTRFLKRMLAGVDPMVAQGRDTTILKEILDESVKLIDLELTNQPAVKADLKLVIGGVYGSLLQPDREEPLLRDALAYYQSLPAGAEQQISDTLSTLAVMHLRQEKFKEAEQEARDALTVETSLQGKPDMRLVALDTGLAWVILRRGGAAQAEEMFQKALLKGQQLVGDRSKELLDTRSGLALALGQQDKFDQAEKLLHDSLSIGQETLGVDHIYVANDMFRLANVLTRHGKFDQAETYARQCLAIRRQKLGMDHPLNEEAVWMLARAVFNEGRQADAADLYGELLEARRKRLGDQDANVVETVNILARLLTVTTNEAKFEQLAGQFSEAWAGRTEFLARTRQWTEARVAASNLLELRPGDHMAYHTMAPLLAQIGDQVAYEELCQKIITRFAGATDPYTADRMAKDCLILPRPGADIKVAGDLAQTAVTLGEKDAGALPFFRCCKALAEYRLGHWDAASDWAAKAAQNGVPWSRAEAAAIRAMSQFKLNQLDKARTALAECDKTIEEKQPKPEEHDLDGDWRDWIIADALQSEAKRMIDGKPPSDARPANPAP